jgi:hypothetical protein
MNLANSRATIGLTTKATPTSTAVNGSVQIGDNPQTITFPDADVAYSVRAFFAAGSPEFDLNLTTGETTGSPAWVAGTAQVETATAAATATGSGNITVTVTSAGMTGSPLAITVPIVSGDTAAVWAGKVRTALAANATIAGRFTVSGTTTAIILTRKPGAVLTDGAETVNLLLADDATLNIAIAAGTTGVSAVVTSTDTTAGVVTSGVLIRDGDAKDFEGVTIPTCVPKAVLFANGGTAALEIDGYGTLANLDIEGGSSILFAGGNVLTGETALTITGSSTFLTVTVLGEAS